MDNEPSFGYLLRDVARILGKVYDQRAREMGLSITQLRAMKTVLIHPGINQTGLAEKLEVEPITLARLVDRMETAGWIERRPDPTDRRVKRLYPTGKAPETWRQCQSMADQVREEALTGFDQEQKDMLMELLRRMHANLTGRCCQKHKDKILQGDAR